MENQPKTPKKRFETLIGYMEIIQGKSVHSIKATFSEHETCIVDYYDKNGYNKFLKIEFPEATLTCFFTEDEMCTYSLYTFKNLINVQEYIEYCNESYPYNFLTKSWEMEKYKVKLELKKNKVIFLFLPFKKVKSIFD